MTRGTVELDRYGFARVEVAHTRESDLAARRVRACDRYGVVPWPELDPAGTLEASVMLEPIPACEVDGWRPSGHGSWDGATGEWSFDYGTGSSTIGGPGHLSGFADAIARHGFRTYGVTVDGGRVAVVLLERDWSAAP